MVYYCFTVLTLFTFFLGWTPSNRNIQAAMSLHWATSGRNSWVPWGQTWSRIRKVRKSFCYNSGMSSNHTTHTYNYGYTHALSLSLSLSTYIYIYIYIYIYMYSHRRVYTSSTAQGGGGSFKNRKPIGEDGCCESGMAERSHWLTERWLELCLLEWLQWLQWSPHPQLLDVVWCTATVVVVVA